MIERLYLIEMPTKISVVSIGSTDSYPCDYLTLNKAYDGTLGLKIYHPNTFEVAPPYYVIKCDDDNFRKVDAKYFINQSDWREQQLKKILEYEEN